MNNNIFENNIKLEHNDTPILLIDCSGSVL